MYLINKDETEHTGQVRDEFQFVLYLMSDQSQDSKGRLQKLQ